VCSVAVCCSVLQCVAACCCEEKRETGVLQCVALCCSVLAVCCSVLHTQTRTQRETRESGRYRLCVGCQIV